MSRAPVKGPEEIDVVLNNLRGQGNYVQGDISEEVLKDPALDEMWEAAAADEGYQLAAKAIAEKILIATLKTMKDHPVHAYKQWIYRLSILEKDGVWLLLLDSTRLAVPEALRGKLLAREHMSHQRQNKTILTVAAKYIWQGYDRDIKEMCSTCEVCQKHGRSKQRQPGRLALEYVIRP